MRLLIDTNVILDMVFKQNGCDIAMELFRRVKNSKTSAYITGKNNKMDYIVTSNKKDYADTLVPVLTPIEWIKIINNI